RNGGFCLCLDSSHLTAELMERGSNVQDKCEVEGSGEFLSEGQKLVTASPSLVRISAYPLTQGQNGEELSLGVLSVEKRMGAVLLGIIKRKPLLRIPPRCRKLSQEERSAPQCPTGFQEDLRGLERLR